MEAAERAVLLAKVEEAATHVADPASWEQWGNSRKARASFAQALLAHEELCKIRELLEVVARAVVPAKAEAVATPAEPVTQERGGKRVRPHRR